MISILPWVFGATIVMLTGWISQVMLARGVTSRGARGVLGSAPLIVGGIVLAMMPYVGGAGLQIALLVVGAGLSGAIYVVCAPMIGEFTPVSAARRGDRDLRRALHARRNPRAMGDGQRDPARGKAARRLHDGLRHQRRNHDRVRIARLALLWPNTERARLDGPRGATEVRVSAMARYRLHCIGAPVASALCARQRCCLALADGYRFHRQL